MSQKIKKKMVQSEAPRYNLKAPKLQNNKNHPLSPSKCTPPFCDELPKSNQDSSSKGGGGGDSLMLAKSTRKA